MFCSELQMLVLPLHCGNLYADTDTYSTLCYRCVTSIKVCLHTDVFILYFIETWTAALSRMTCEQDQHFL